MWPALPRISLHLQQRSDSGACPCVLQAMVRNIDFDKGWLQLSTWQLEANPGDMLRDAKAVYEGAEAQAQAFRESPRVRRRIEVGTGLGDGFRVCRPSQEPCRREAPRDPDP